MGAEIETIYLVHHSHTDVGYTHDQPVVWELQSRFIDAALDLAEAGAERDGPDAFRWTVETTAPLRRWLATAPERQVERLQRLERAGRVEITAMFANITPLYDLAQLVESLQNVGRLRRDYGLRVDHAMNCDVNGQNWTLVEALLDAGVSGFGMSINEHFGGSPLRRPNAFWWEGPSGRRLLTWNGWHYMMGNQLGLGTSLERFQQRLPEALAHLREIDHPLPALMVQTTHPFGDNGSAFPGLSAFVRAWNAAGDGPRVVLATPRQWWAAVRAHGDRLAVHRGDWTDFWNFGCISSAREQAVNRRSRSRLLAADALSALLPAVAARGRTPAGQGVLADDSPARRSDPVLRAQAWEALNLWDEHTWGADVSVGQPENPDTAAQWVHKAHCAYLAHSLSGLMLRDAAAELARRLPRGDDEALVVCNPLPWARTVAGPVPARVLEPRGTADDPTATRHYQDRASDAPRQWLPPTEVPGFGYAVVSRSALLPVEHLPPGALPDALGPTVGAAGGNPLAGGPPPAASARGVSEAAVVENHRHRLTFDRQTGGIVSWIDRRLERELVDGTAGWPMFGYVHESVADTAHPSPRQLLWRGDASPVRAAGRGWQGEWRARRRGPEAVIRHACRRLPGGWEVLQHLRAPGAAGLVAQRTYLPDHADHVVFEAWWEMGLETRPEATYLAFPFQLPGAAPRLDIGGQAVRPGLDQLPGSVYDYFTVQRFAAWAGPEAGVIVATPDNPMVQLGGFHFGRGRREFEPPERAMLLGWVTNNYWETNFRAHQPGRVSARYCVLPYAGPFDESAAHRFGAAMACPPVFQGLQEPAATPSLPGSGSWLRLPQQPVLVTAIVPAPEGALTLRLWNASDSPAEARIAGGVLSLVSAAEADPFGEARRPLELAAGEAVLRLAPRRPATVRLEVR